MTCKQQKTLYSAANTKVSNGFISEYKLCPMESSPGAYKNIQYILVFRSNCKERAVDALQTSFDRLTDLYPIVKGHRVTRDNGNAIAVDKNDLESQRMFVYNEKQLTVDNLVKVRYRRNLWPQRINLLLQECVENTKRLISVAIVCLDDGFLISFSVSHMVADGAGVFYLLRQWASLSKQMLENQLVAEPLPELPVNFDHLIFWNKLAESSKDVHPYVDYVLQQENNSNLGSMQQDFETLCNTGNISLQKTLNTRILHLSAEGIARLSSDFNKAGSEQSIHGVQIFYALLWQRYIVASQSVQCKGGEQDDAAEKPVFLNILHNIRHMVCDAASYVGNAVTGVYVSEMPSTLLQMPVIETTRFIKSHINRITPGAAVNITEQSFNPKSDFILRVLSLQRKFGVCMAISNVSKLPFSNLDFGIGAVAAMISGTLPTEGMTSWMPHVSENGKGGVDIYCGLQQDVYEKMKNDDMLAKYAQFKN